MYTDGSRLGSDSFGSGICISFWHQEIKIQRKNPVFCSVFRSELVTILEGLNSFESLPQLYDVWIFSDSRSVIQHLANWHNVRDRTDVDILKILKRLFLSHQNHFEWIPSRVDIAGNEIVDSLATAGTGETTTPAAPLTYLELFSKYKAKNKAIWMGPLVHPCYTKAFGDGPRNFEPWSSDEDETCAGTPSPRYHTKPRMFEFSTNLTCIAPLHGGSTVALVSNS
ncbi:RNase H domain-containing protein [Trichonephila clavipes]|nr:RNase H domain-containing protein [Trichonephila clavipes]